MSWGVCVGHVYMQDMKLVSAVPTYVNVITAWINNHMLSQVWDEITYSF